MDEVILKTEALRLPARERALLAEALLDSLDDAESQTIKSAWAEETDARLNAFKNEEIQAEEASEVLRELRARYGK